MAQKRSTWAEQWFKFLTNHSYQEAISFLNQQVCENRGTPNTKVKSEAITIMIESLSPHDLYNAACQLTQQPHPTAKEMAAYLLIAVYDQNPSEVMKMLYLLADDGDWEVREWAASACGEKLTDDFVRFYPEMVIWVTSESPNVRRAAALAVKYACKTKRAEWAEPLLDLIEPLLTDSDPYVKKNLGPFTIGDALLRAYPVATVERLQKWIEIDEENVRWNIAKAFTTAEGAKIADKAVTILKVLVGDERSTVKRAVKSAMNNLMKRQPDIYDLLVKEISH